MKRISYLFIILSIILFSGCSLGNDNDEQSTEKQPVPVLVEKVQQKSVEHGERFIGKIKADQDLYVLPKISGKVQEIYIKQGDMVKEGQILMRLDDTYVNDTLLQAEASYKSALSNLNQAKERQSSSILQAEAQLELAEDSYEQAEKNLEDIKELYDDGRVNETQLDQAETAFLQADNNLKIARDSLEKAKSSSNIGALEAGLNQAELGLEQARRAVNDTKVLATISGQIASVMVEVGEMASQQQPVVQIINQNIVYVNLNVTENSLNNFREGERIDIYIPSLNKNITGEITFISPVANEQTLTFTIEIKISNKDRQLKAGMLVETLLTYVDNEEYIVIPTQAILGTGKDTYVFIVKEGKAYKKGITVREMATEEAIIESGLFVDDEVVIKGQYYLENGSDVEIVQEEGETS